MARFIETGDEQRAKARADREQDFTDWMADVDEELAAKLGGLTSRDLPDQTYRDFFDDEMDPAEVAEQVLDNEGIDLS